MVYHLTFWVLPHPSPYELADSVLIKYGATLSAATHSEPDNDCYAVFRKSGQIAYIVDLPSAECTHVCIPGCACMACQSLTGMFASCSVPCPK